MALASTDSAFPWPPQPPNGWSLPAFALGAFWYLGRGLSAKGRILLVPQGVVVFLAFINAFFIFQQEPAETALARAGVAALVLWSLVGSYCAASFRGDAYRRWCADNGLTPLVPTQWQWGRSCSPAAGTWPTACA